MGMGRAVVQLKSHTLPLGGPTSRRGVWLVCAAEAPGGQGCKVGYQARGRSPSVNRAPSVPSSFPIPQNCLLEHAELPKGVRPPQNVPRRCGSKPALVTKSSWIEPFMLTVSIAVLCLSAGLKSAGHFCFAMPSESPFKVASGVLWWPGYVVHVTYCTKDIDCQRLVVRSVLQGTPMPRLTALSICGRWRARTKAHIERKGIRRQADQDSLHV
jgi:hypothetical protein